MLRNLRVDLNRYPEIQRAFETSDVVLSDSIASDPLFAQTREEWQQQGHEVETTSALAIPFSVRGEQLGIFYLRTSGHDAVLNQLDVQFAAQVIKSAVTTIEKAYEMQAAVEGQKQLRELAENGEEPPSGVLLARNSPLGVFVRRLDLEFSNLQFDHASELWMMFVKYRQPTAAYWRRRNPHFNRLSFDSVLLTGEHEWGPQTDELAVAAYGNMLLVGDHEAIGDPGEQVRRPSTQDLAEDLVGPFEGARGRREQVGVVTEHAQRHQPAGRLLDQRRDVVKQRLHGEPIAVGGGERLDERRSLRRG